jgi:hypothetical protein
LGNEGESGEVENEAEERGVAAPEADHDDGGFDQFEESDGEAED